MVRSWLFGDNAPEKMFFTICGWFFSFKGHVTLHMMKLSAGTEGEMLQLLSCFLYSWVDHQEIWPPQYR